MIGQNHITLQDSRKAPFDKLRAGGEGGMGVVYKAQDAQLDRLVALANA